MGSYSAKLDLEGMFLLELRDFEPRNEEVKTITTSDWLD